VCKRFSSLNRPALNMPASIKQETTSTGEATEAAAQCPYGPSHELAVLEGPRLGGGERLGGIEWGGWCVFVGGCVVCLWVGGWVGWSGGGVGCVFVGGWGGG